MLLVLLTFPFCSLSNNFVNIDMMMHLGSDDAGQDLVYYK